MAHECKDFYVQGLYSVEQLQERCSRLGLTMNSVSCHINEELVRSTRSKTESKPKMPVCSEEYEVEEILNCVQEQGQIWFYVKWKDWEDTFNTWEPERNLSNSSEAVSKYFEKKKRQKQKAVNGVSTFQLQQMYNRHQIRDFTRRILKDDDVATMLKFCGMSYVHFQNCGKTPKQLYKHLRLIVESFLAGGKIENQYSVLSQTLTSCNGFRTELLEFAEKRQAVLKQLNEWVLKINSLPGVKVPIVVENDCDFEGPPENFTYITDYQAGEGIVIPDDPLVGCSCQDCYKQQKSCCVAQSTGEYAYNKFGYLRVDEGTPIYECNKRCLCSANCSNRVVQKGRTVKLAIFRTHDGRGWGVKALEKIKKGQFVMEYVGEVITTEEADKRGEIYDAQGRTYLFDLDFNDGDNQYTVDAAHLGNISHFMNHSCDPNLYVFTVWINNLDPTLPRIAFFAKHDIKRGDELSFDYKMKEVQYGLSSNHGTISPHRPSTSKMRSDRCSLSPTTPIMRVKKEADSMELDDDDDVVILKRIPCKCGAANCRKYLY